MKKYTISFTGRQTGAIGITYKIRDEYRANNLGEALYKLYTDYEHISISNVLEGSKSIEFKDVELVKCDTSDCYPHRERDSKTGAYMYTRSNTPTQ